MNAITFATNRVEKLINYLDIALNQCMRRAAYLLPQCLSTKLRAVAESGCTGEYPRRENSFRKDWDQTTLHSKYTATRPRVHHMHHIIIAMSI